ncbi:MAG: ammonium transporter [Myxococcales bacterium]|nr:ammonium transporter [Myxococcales bacterium]
MPIDSGDTTWILVSSAMVLLMTPGLAFFYGGLVRGKNVLNTMMMSMVAMGLVAILWALGGYSLAFAPGNAFVGGLDFLGFAGVGAAPLEGQTIPHALFATFQMMFAVITPALISGAVVERMKFKAYVPFIALWSILVYAPLAHWVWGGGWLAADGALDFAGGTVVHVSAGVSAIVVALLVGARADHKKRAPRPHNVPFVLLGASMLWFGWFGFNAGSALAADGIAVNAFLTTNLAAAGALVAWTTIETFKFGRPSAVGAATGIVCGLVTITPACGFVTPMGAIAMGALGAVGCFLTIQLMHKVKRLDDSLDVFACHGMGGILGSILTGVFATTAVNPNGADGLLYGNAGLLWTQTVAVLAAGAYAAVGSAVILLPIQALMGLRADPESEAEGLDVGEHAEGAYESGTMHPAPERAALGGMPAAAPALAEELG